MSLVIFLNINILSQNHTSTWQIQNSPIYSDLSNLFIFDGGTGYALGNELIKLENGNWKIVTKDFDGNPQIIFANAIDQVWVVLLTDFQDSEMLLFDGINWKQTYNPLANKVYDLLFENSHFGVISGIGEIAIFRNNNWTYLDPPFPYVLKQIKVTDDSTIWILAADKCIFYYKDDNWFSINSSEDTRLIYSKNNFIYSLKDTTLYKIDAEKLEIHSYFNLLNNVNSFDVLNDKNIFACGQNGLILTYKDGIWKKDDSPVKTNLNSIKMLSDTSGWIVGDEGTILKYSTSKENIFSQPWKGFKKIKLYREAKIVDDEYGISAADYNGDGLTDIFTCGLYEENRLYINKGNMEFVDEAGERGIITSKNELNLGCCSADVDNDGDQDLYVTLLNGKNILYKNNGDGNFVDYSSYCNALGKASDRTNSASFCDVDNDGDVDLFITNEYSTNRLYLNNGAGIFQEITEEANLISIDGGTGCSFGDIDNDGDLDLYVTNWSRKNILYKNLFVEKNNLEFVDITDSAGVAGNSYSKSNAIIFADIDNDADLDLFVTNRKISNILYINNGKGIFKDRTEELLGLDSLKSYGAAICDFDLDGYKDIYVANVGENVLYKNIQGKAFHKVTDKYAAELSGYNTGTSIADLDNDGDYDIYAASYLGEGSTVFENKLNNDKYIKIKIEGIKNNRNGIGTKIFIYPHNMLNDSTRLIFYSIVTAGESYGSMNELIQIIPTIDNEFVDIKVVFPIGPAKHITHVKKGEYLIVSDIEGFDKFLILSFNYISRLFLDTNLLIQMLKWIFVITLLFYLAIRGKRKFIWSYPFIFSLSLSIIILFYWEMNFLSHKNFLLSTVVPLTSIIVILILIHLYFERKHTKEQAEIEKQQIREKLSRDLHDDLSGTIGSIAIYNEILNRSMKADDNKLLEIFSKTNELIEDATNSIADLIWTIKPSAESIDKIMKRLLYNYLSLFREKGIDLIIDSDKEVKNQKLDAIQKHNVYLTLKEALTNIMKYSKASKAVLTITQLNDMIEITVKDNGIGFDINHPDRKGNGLQNMQRRSEEINGKLNLYSEENKGTTISLKFNIA